MWSAGDSDNRQLENNSLLTYGLDVILLVLKMIAISDMKCYAEYKPDRFISFWLHFLNGWRQTINFDSSQSIWNMKWAPKISVGYWYLFQVSILLDTSFRYKIQVSILFDTWPRYPFLESTLFDTLVSIPISGIDT